MIFYIDNDFKMEDNEDFINDIIKNKSKKENEDNKWLLLFITNKHITNLL